MSSDYNTKRTILLTGGTGYLGARLALAFLEQGYRLKVLVRSQNESPELKLKRVFNSISASLFLTSFIRSGQLEILLGDVRIRQLGLPSSVLLRLNREVTDLVHCAAMVSFDSSKAPELEAVNVQGTRNVLELIKDMKDATLHYVSTAFVAGRTEGLVEEGKLNGRCGFNNKYEETKYWAEQEVRDAMDHGLQAVIYRPSIIVGDSHNGQTQSFIGFYILLRALWVVLLRARKFLKRHPYHFDTKRLIWEKDPVFVPLRVVGSESKTLNIVPIDYAVQTILGIFRQDSVGKTFHIVNFNPPTIGQLRDWMCQALGLKGVLLVTEEESERMPKNRWERFFAESTKGYAAYLNGKEPVFKAENTLQLIQREEVPRPVTDAKFIQLLTSYCLASNWGRGKEKERKSTSLLTQSTLS